MTRFLAYLALAALALGLPASAQQQTEGGGFLERLIEDSLSGDDRDVVIEGFEGLLSGEARFRSLTISDADGVWLSVSNAQLDWSQFALLRGRLSVTLLTAEEVTLARPPLPAEAELPDPEAASGFSLPDLPLAVEIGEISIDRLSLGAPLFGEAAELSLTGNANLGNGEGSVLIDADRLDAQGTFAIEGSYANDTDALDLRIVASEAPDGIIVNLMNIPGTPSLDLSVTGAGPLTDYTADIRLATEGQDRLSGEVSTEVAPDGTRAFVATLGGDVTPLFLPQFRDFFGEDLSLDLAATRAPDGTVDISNFELSAQSLALAGNLAIGPEGLPIRADIDGDIFSEDGDGVVLPASGPPVRIGSATLDVSFDAATDEAWSTEITVTGLDGAGYSAETLSVIGAGELVPRAPNRRLAGAINLAARALDLGSEEIDTALGSDVTGLIRFDWAEGRPLSLTQLTIEGETYGLDGEAAVSGFDSGFDITTDLTARAENLSAFSGIAGRPLAGTIAATLTGTAEVLTGQFDMAITAATENLSVGQEEADRVLAGAATFDLTARRDETGLTIEELTLESPNARIAGDVTLNSGASRADLRADLSDLGLIVPELPGPAQIIAEASQNGEVWSYDAALIAPGSEITAAGTATTEGEIPLVIATITAQAEDLSEFEQLAGRPLAGALDVQGRVSALTDLSAADLNITGEIADVTIGQPQADALLGGTSELILTARVNTGIYRLDRLSLDGEALTLEASGSYGDGNGALDLDASIADASLLAPDVTGPVNFTATAQESAGGLWAFDMDGDAPQTVIRADGTASPFATPMSVNTTLAISADDLSLFSTLVGQSIAGSVALEGTLAATSDLSAVEADLRGRTEGLRTGITAVDQLVAGDGSLGIIGSVDDDTLTITELFARTDALTIEADGGAVDGTGTVALNARLADLGVFLPGFNGAATVEGTVAIDGSDPLELDLTGRGPAGISLQARGTAEADASNLDLSLTGSAPLGLANRFIEPVAVEGDLRFDMAVNGPPALASVSGQVTASDGRLVVPANNIRLEDIAATVTLAQERATLDVTANVDGGGRIAVSGPVGLTEPFNGSIRTVLTSVYLTDEALYETEVSGDLRIDGPLAGGAAITGRMLVEETEINIAASTAGASGTIPDITHVGETAAIRQTRQYAGLVREDRGEGGGGGTGGSNGYPLDVDVSVSRMFVRGRGLDAELAGDIRVTGTTSEPRAIGQIDLVRGRWNLLGSRLTVEEGAILLQGSLIPSIQLRAARDSRAGDDVEAFVTVQGPVTAPEISFESSPPLPEDEVLARILFGSDLANISALQAAQLAAAAATLAGTSDGPGVVGSIRENLGVDDLDVTTDENGNTAVTAGAYLSDELYADVTTRSDGETELRLNLDLSDSVTVSGSTANTGESTLGIFFQRDY